MDVDDGDDTRADLEQTLHRITQLTDHVCNPGHAALAQAAQLLDGFISRHRHELTFENFPLPAGSDEALCSYELHGDARSGLTLWLQAMNAGVDSLVHDHGTWAVIVAVIGQERNRIYDRADNGSIADRATLALQREVVVSPGQPLVLDPGLFHSIHTAAGEPTLQLHLYGRNPDTVENRRVVDLASGRLVYLGVDPSSV